MENYLHVDYAAVEQAAQQVMANHEALREKMPAVQDTQAAAAQTWQGKGATKFLTWVTDHALWEGNYFVNELEQYASFLRQVMKSLQAHDESWAARIRNVLNEE